VLYIFCRVGSLFLFINLSKFTEEFTKINAKQEIPVIELDGIRLTQSLPIIEYLDETRPQSPQLIPKDPVKRAKARAIAEIINSGIQPYQNTSVVKHVLDLAGEEKKVEWLRFYLSKGFRAIEEALKETSGKYCIGDDITIADLCLIPQVYAAHRFSVDLTPFPICRRINAELEKMEAFRKAHAHRQVDTLPELREN
jgi:maleylacetoacetate isomerase